MFTKVHWKKAVLVALVAVFLVLGVRLTSIWSQTPLPTSERRFAALFSQRVVRLFHLIFYYDSNTWDANTWLGVPAQQNPNDVWIIQEILSEVKPDFVVETGTLEGGSAACWASILEQVNPEARVITVDIVDTHSEAEKLPVVQRRVEFLLGSSTAPEIVAGIKERVAGHSAVVILDSDHSKAHVAEELRAYSPLVNVGSYLIVQDTNINGHPVAPGWGPGPMEAVEEFLAGNDEFEVDTSRERLLFTLHPRGFLKRVKAAE
ncbi:MAG: cephalosporin hydroxylase [bacterium]|nr:cephalosporin hydroxylase [bacterium]